MKRAAFLLVAGVIGFQLLLVTAVTATCIVRSNTSCTQGQVREHLAYILAQSLGLYAAEANHKKQI